MLTLKRRTKDHKRGLWFVNNPEDIYLSPRSQTMKTTNPFSNLFATLSAAANAPPLLIPAKIAYYFASLFTIYMDSS